jgi:hypothetical protein
MSAPAVNIPSDIPLDQRSLTIGEFCAIELRGSKATYYKLRRQGHGPEELIIAGTNIKRITPQAIAAWREQMKKLADTKAAKREEAKRQRQRIAAGKKSATLPQHISKKSKKTGRRARP